MMPCFNNLIVAEKLWAAFSGDQLREGSCGGRTWRQEGAMRLALPGERRLWTLSPVFNPSGSG